MFIIALDVPNDQLYVLLPPGNDAFAGICAAEPCAEPIFDNTHYRQLSIEHHPKQPPTRTMLANGSIIETYAFEMLEVLNPERFDDPYR